MSERRLELPRPIRNAAIGCLVLAGAIGVGAANNLAALLQPNPAEPPSLSSGLGDPEIDAAFKEAQAKSFGALQGMRGSRIVILSALAAACALTFVSASRLLRPGPLSRDGQRKLLGGAALTAAVLRTLDGAQLTSAAGRFRPAVELAMSKLGLPSGLSVFPLVMTIGLTALMAGGLLVVSQYFRSERVKKIVAFADRGPERL